VVHELEPKLIITIMHGQQHIKISVGAVITLGQTLQKYARCSHAVLLKIPPFVDTMCHSDNTSQHFKVLYCSHLQGNAVTLQ